jgi:TctA family transporter
VAGNVGRLAVVAVAGWIVVHGLQLGPNAFFLVVAASFALYASMLAAAIRLGGWSK